MKIKCLLMAAVIAMLFMPVQVQAQEELETRHEIGISYGSIPNSVWFNFLSDIIPAMFWEKFDNHKYVGPIGLEYYYHTSPLIGVGAVAVFSNNTKDGFYKEIQTSHMTQSYFTFMPSMKLDWLRKHNWGMYTKLAAGVTYAHVTDQDYENGKKTDEKITSKDLLFNFQASLVGIEAGNNHVRGFAELGIGEQGVVLGGVRFKF